MRLPQGGTKRYRHPGAGLLTFDYTVMQVTGEAISTVQLVTYVPANATTRQKVALLLKEMNMRADPSLEAAVSVL